VTNGKFTFIDLFAGVGGTRIAFERCGGKCIFSSEKDPVARSVYKTNFGMIPQEDITLINPNDKMIGNPDILVAGFPCQAFSAAGKKLGFEDPRGTLFYYIVDILKEKKPRAFFLENVRGLVHHNSGETMKEILRILREELGYYVPDPQVFNALNYGVPQNRDRVFFVGFSKKTGIKEFSFPSMEAYTIEEQPKLADILSTTPVSTKYYLSEGYLSCLKKHKLEQKNNGRGYGYKVRSPFDWSHALTVGGMGRERNLIYDPRIYSRSSATKKSTPINSENLRTLTPREFARLQGFSDSFVINVSDINAYRLFGNSVAIPAVEAVARKIVHTLIGSGEIKAGSWGKTHELYKKPECRNSESVKIIKEKLKEQGFHLQTPTGVKGNPDIAYKSKKIAIFIYDEIYHGYEWETQKKFIQSNMEHWVNRIEQTIEDDIKAENTLREEGWHVLKYWCGTVFNDAEKCTGEILNFLSGSQRFPQ